MPDPVSVKYEPQGVKARVEVEGQDLSDLVSRVSIDHAAGDAPVVYLQLKPGTDVSAIDVEAFVHVKEVVQEDPADATLRFLEPIDAGEFERACLQAMELGGPATFGEAALAVLRGYARGD